MIIIKFSGGLGNQMFQYALYKSFCEKGIETYADTSFYDTNSCHNGFELEKLFPIQLKRIDIAYVKEYAYTSNNIFSKFFRKFFPKETFYQEIGEKSIIYNPKVFEFKNKYLFGYWQSEKYFKEIESIIRNEFTFREDALDVDTELLKKIASDNSVSMHIRRGDYLNTPIYKDVCTLEYYNNAINFIKKHVENPKLYIFSNDIEWCKRKFKNENFYFVENRNKSMAFMDMFYMKNCKNNIIANSSFSWWAAWLNSNRDKIVIAPDKWLNYDIGSSDIIPETWISFS